MSQTRSENIRFITSVYGKKYGGMLLVLLYSIKKSNPYARVTIFWRDVSATTRLLETVFPDFEFIDITEPIKGIFLDKIAHKTILWAKAAQMYKGERLVFVDVDMLVCKDVNIFFEEEFDIAFTYKENEVYPINTGTFLTQGTEGTSEFFETWRDRTMKIIKDPELLYRATTQEYPYGGPDQMAFYDMIGYTKGVVSYRISCGGKTLRCVGFSCERLNETNSRPIHDDTYIIHYKGGWHDILLDGADFTLRRKKKDSWEMYLLYLRTYQEALGYAQKITNINFSYSAFGIRKHFYLSNDLEESPQLRILFVWVENVLAPIRFFISRVGRKIASLRK